MPEAIASGLVERVSHLNKLHQDYQSLQSRLKSVEQAIHDADDRFDRSIDYCDGRGGDRRDVRCAKLSQYIAFDDYQAILQSMSRLCREYVKEVICYAGTRSDLERETGLVVHKVSLLDGKEALGIYSFGSDASPFAADGMAYREIIEQGVVAIVEARGMDFPRVPRVLASPGQKKNEVTIDRVTCYSGKPVSCRTDRGRQPLDKTFGKAIQEG